MNINAHIAEELKITEKQVATVVTLLDEGNTVPFIARYRKEATGALNDGILRALLERLTCLRSLNDRRATILQAIEEQGALTEDLRRSIEEAMTATALEDLYRPYKQKRRTRAMIAKEKGLEPLAEVLLSKAAADPHAEAGKYVDAGKEIGDAETALQMARDIIAERLSDHAEVRRWIRARTFETGLLTSERSRAAKKTSDETDDASDKRREKTGGVVNKKLAARADVYENYYEYSESLKKIPGHRILAINRGEKEKFLTVHVETDADAMAEYLYRSIQVGNKNTEEQLRKAAEDAYKRLIAPSIENEIRSSLTEKAEDGAIKVFGDNLKQLLLQPPIHGKTVLGWDPAFRTGCKLAVVDPTGRVLDTTVIYPTAPQNKVEESKKTLRTLCEKYHVDIISVGNGTASRESEQIIADFIRESGMPLQYVIVNEAGASVYSASKLADTEFPQFDVGLRSAASIARRLQDPLAELVKIDPKAVGVGQYQHDMNEKRLDETLSGVVESAVNSVGVDMNTASASLLSYIAGINKTIAANIVKYREENGPFKRRKDLLKVAKLGPKAFEQCAGFLRIRDGEEPLDNTGVHPESYPAVRILMEKLGLTVDDMRATGTTSGEMIRKRSKEIGVKKLAMETGLGEYTLSDILEELAKPGRDPREEAQKPVLRGDVLSVSDLKVGMELKGTVRNIVDFGAFVDIGVHQDGLVHISQLADRFVKHPMGVVHVGDVVRVKVLGVDEKKGRISLTMRL